MSTDVIQFAADGRSRWAGMGDYLLVSPDGRHRLQSLYAGEPPHGDSFHRLHIDGRAFPGHAWGCCFAFSACSRYCVFSWMAQRYERRTVVVDLEQSAYFTLPHYFPDFTLQWPTVVCQASTGARRSYTVSGQEAWISFAE
ncbi:hypothetical protein H5407_18970 [Mitsuaria sp. WAJ17]|uniref:hypothetical protein n=1 Tax=Mitsuaria sp. WAJ17 TaxID=2761452 RepID=UPI001600BF95|nr:hypothetical protein [Mitsuaria sp. WAJ17]MBB2487322.1 hypothetical protein [Mitsuaria sp. WAJ17]